MTDAEINAMCEHHRAWVTREHRRWHRWYLLMQAATIAPAVLLWCGADWWTLLPLPVWWYARAAYHRSDRRLTDGLEHHRDVLQAELKRRIARLWLDQ